MRANKLLDSSAMKPWPGDIRPGDLVAFNDDSSAYIVLSFSGASTDLIKVDENCRYVPGVPIFPAHDKVGVLSALKRSNG